MIRHRVPKRVWDFGIVWEGRILSQLCQNGTAVSRIERIMGDTPDISEWLGFEFYDLCRYWDVPNVEENPKLG